MYVWQHPKNIDSKDTNIISYKRPPKPLFPRYSIPNEALDSYNASYKSPIGSKLIEVAVVGPPNAGKSSLINTIIQKELTASSNKKGTTDELKNLYYVKGLTQIVLKDTPGATKIDNTLRSQKLVSKWWGWISSADLTLFVVDSVKRLDFDVKAAAHRLSKVRANLKEKMLLDKMASQDFDFTQYKKDSEPMIEDEMVPVNKVLIQVNKSNWKNKMITTQYGF